MEEPPLHYAVNTFHGQLECVKFLVSEGANIYARDYDGKTPSDVARENGHSAIVMYLKKSQEHIQKSDLDTRYSMAVALCNQGKYKEALQAYQEVFNIQEIKFGPDHPDTLLTRHSIAGVLDDQGKCSGALQAYQEVFKKRKVILGPDHPDTLSTRYNIAIVLNNLGKHSEALQTYQEVFNIQKVKLGPDHPDALLTRHSMAGVLDDQGKYSEAFQAYQKVFNIQKVKLGPDHQDALLTRYNMAVVFYSQGKHDKALQVYAEVWRRKVILGPDHPDTLLTRNKMEEIRKEQSRRQKSGHSSIQFCQEQKKAYLHLSRFVSDSLQNASIEPVKQGLYLPSFEKREVKINGKCVAITRGLSQALLLQGDKSFLSNLETSAKIYERIAQGKQISKREEREIFAFSKLLNNFERQLDSATNSLPSSLIHNKGYKTLSDLSNYIAEIKGDFAIHLVTNNHVVAIYRTGDNYAYFDSNAAFVSGLKSVDQLMQIVEKAVESAGYKVEEKGFLIEHFDVEQANKLLSSEGKQILAKEIKTERQLLAEQDKELGLIKINGQELSRVQLYDFGTKINVEGSVPLLINADMNLSSKKFQGHLDRKEVSMTAREYLDSLKNGKGMEEAAQATKFIPFEGSSREIEEAEQTRRPKQFVLEQLVKGTINSILAAVSLANISRSESQLPGKTDNRQPRTCLNDPAVDNQLQRSPGFRLFPSGVV